MIRPMLVLSCVLAAVGGCAGSTPHPNSEFKPVSEESSVAVAAPVSVEPTERAIPQESLYGLLVAEFALRRKQYDVALSHYMEQAPRLLDAGVSAHTTNLAQFLQQDQQAREAARLWVELDPDNAQANSTIATLLARSGETLEALPYMAVAARSGEPVNFPLLANDFDALSPTQQDELVNGLEALIAELPENEQLLIALALAYEELNQPQQALVKLKQVFEEDEFQPQAVLLEAKILQELGKDRAFVRMEKALKAKPGNRRLRLQYARLLTRTDMDAARAQFELLSAQNPHDADLLFSLAVINRETGNIVEAKAYLKQMLLLRERTDEAHLYLGQIAEEEGSLNEAIQHYSQVQNGREFLNATNRVSRILIRNGQLNEAHEFYDILRTKHPERAEQLFAMEADQIVKAGHASLALEVLTQGLEVFPDSMSLRYTRSMVGEQVNDMAMMENDLRAIIIRDPSNATALNALGYTLANRTQRYAEAEELIVRALAIQPTEPAILDSMGWVKYRQGEYEAAVAYLLRAYAAFPDPEVAAHLGEVLWVKGEREQALNVWRQALDKNPEHAVLLETLGRLGVDTSLADYTPIREQ